MSDALFQLKLDKKWTTIEEEISETDRKKIIFEEDPYLIIPADQMV